jgi:glycerate 2-kinase
MAPPGGRYLREDAIAIFRAGLEAVRPDRLLEREFREESDGWHLGEHGLPFPGSEGRLRIFGAGKAAAHVTKALTGRLSARSFSGRIIVKYGHGLPLTGIVVEQASHPLPDEAGVAATRRLLEDLSDGRADDRIFFVLTGGASALLVAPAEGLELADTVRTTDLLLRSGATIQELNTVRKHVSSVKGGRLMMQMTPALALGLVVSDVIGDDLSSIGSGPAVTDPTTYEESVGILVRYGVMEDVPETVRQHLARGVEGAIEETPKPGTVVPVPHVILASNRRCLDAALEDARRRGYEAEIVAHDMTGNVHERARAFARSLRERLKGSRRVALLAGGELTLEVTGSGQGGRNQEFALVVAMELAGLRGVEMLSAGTDGTDGPTDAAGAIADGTTVERARGRGLDAEAILANNDSYRLFDAIGDLLRTGPTGTNVNDVVVGLVDPDSR